MLLSRAGRVETVSEGVVTVRVARPAGCARCARGDGCGLGLATGPDEQSLRIACPDSLDLSEGDTVRVVVEDRGLTRACAAVYGIPLVALAGGALTAAGLGVGEYASIGIAMVAFLAGLELARRAAVTLSAGERCRLRLLGPGPAEGALRD